MYILIAIISDIHGNLPALENIIKDIQKYRVTKIISLGDVAGYYPFINEVIELLKLHDILNLIGNHDRYIIDNTECHRSHTANTCLEYQKSVISDSNKEWLKQSISKYEFDDVSMVHGGWRDSEDEYMYRVTDGYFDKLDFKYYFCGHTHVQKHIVLKNGKEFINPGSVGQPRDGDSRASYCIFDLETKEITLRKVSYNIDVISDKMKSLGFNNKVYTNLYKGTRIGGKVDNIGYEK